MPLTPEQFTEKIKGIIYGDNSGDTECTHGMSDDAMEELLIELGYGEGIEIIRNSRRWYA